MYINDMFTNSFYMSFSFAFGLNINARHNKLICHQPPLARGEIRFYINGENSARSFVGEKTSNVTSHLYRIFLLS